MKPFAFLLIFISLEVSFPPAFGAHSDSLKVQVSSCFSDYIKNMSKVGLSKPKEIEDRFSMIRKRCLTIGFNREWQKLIESTDADALLLTQDYYESWKDFIDVAFLDSDASHAKVILGKGKEIHCLMIGIEKTASRILISSSKACAQN